MPPVDIIPEVIRPLIQFMNISNAAILHDESFGNAMFVEQTLRRRPNDVMKVTVS